MRKSSTFWRSDRGSFTMEASLTFPLILLLTFTVVFACLFFYQRTALHYAAEQTAERAAYTWDNSSKEWSTGYFALGRTDGLYWRTFQDSVFDIFRAMAGKRTSAVALPTARGEGLQGSEKKLSRAAGTMASQVGGHLSYTNYWLIREVEAKLRQSFAAPLYAWRWLKRDRVGAEASSYVVEPVEFVRTVDMVRTFVQEVKGRLSPEAALATFHEPARIPPEDVEITNHDQAAAYLRKLVAGTRQDMELGESPKRVRQIDALDAAGIAHQAFYTFSEFQLRTEQMPKDVELLKKAGLVKGVVWHFFRQRKQEKVVLSHSLREELRQKGIIVVVHE